MLTINKAESQLQASPRINSLLSQRSQKLPSETTSLAGKQSWDANESLCAGRGVFWAAPLTEAMPDAADRHLITAGWWSSHTDARCSAAPSAIRYWAHIRAAVSSDESSTLPCVCVCMCVCWPRIKVFTRVFPLRVNPLYKLGKTDLQGLNGRG